MAQEGEGSSAIPPTTQTLWRHPVREAVQPPTRPLSYHPQPTASATRALLSRPCSSKGWSSTATITAVSGRNVPLSEPRCDGTHWGPRCHLCLMTHFLFGAPRPPSSSQDIPLRQNPHFCTALPSFSLPFPTPEIPFPTPRWTLLPNPPGPKCFGCMQSPVHSGAASGF